MRTFSGAVQRRRRSTDVMISTRSLELVIDTVVCLTLAKWETVSGQFGGYLSKALLKSKRLLIINSAKRLSSAKSIPSFSTYECDTFYTKPQLKSLPTSLTLAKIRAEMFYLAPLC
jgi:hypothetical protein